MTPEGEKKSEPTPASAVSRSIQSISRSFFSMTAALIMALIFAISIAAATFIEARSGTEAARSAVYNAFWFEILLALVGLNLAATLIRQRLWRKGKRTVFLFHLAFLFILAGAAITRHFGFSGSMNIREGQASDTVISDKTSQPVRLPFSLRLEDFRVDRYPGSMKPSGFTSDVTVIDTAVAAEKPYSIFMNHILRHRGYRFYQSSYDDDEMGTVLTVSRDPGMIPTYAGYVLLGLFLLVSLFSPGGRFRTLGRAVRAGSGVALSLLFLLSAPAAGRAGGSSAGTSGFRGRTVSRSAFERHFGRLAVQDNQGRIKPLQSMTIEWIRSVPGLGNHGRGDADRIAFLLFVRPDTVLQTGEKTDFSPASGYRLFPVPGDPAGRWVTAEAAEKRLQTAPDPAAAFAAGWAGAMREAGLRSDWNRADSLVSALEDFQASHGGRSHPGSRRLKMEILHNRLDGPARLAQVVFWAGLGLLIFSVIASFRHDRPWKTAEKVLTVTLLACFAALTCGLGLRAWVSGHAPWTNRYETMVFIAWAGLLAGTLFGGRNRPALAAAGILSGLFLLAAASPAMDPKINTLAPVLKSVWLIIHVSVITSSYGFLGLGAVLAVFNLVLLVLPERERTRRAVLGQTAVTERCLLVGLVLLTIGNFLGAVWANESWGRYWGWDPKETWTLVTILLYAGVLHFRLVPGLRGPAAFNAGSLWAFGSVLMTYLGVNLYLSGMHSYATGAKPALPAAVFAAAGLAALLSAAALVRGRRFRP
ncbi:MAG: cytochrome c biogenesis protein CcsA [bacterium]|nr:cytochrome c biogenesis protein CcsA [bacterium]